MLHLVVFPPKKKVVGKKHTHTKKKRCLLNTPKLYLASWGWTVFLCNSGGGSPGFHVRRQCPKHPQQSCMAQKDSKSKCHQSFLAIFLMANPT